MTKTMDPNDDYLSEIIRLQLKKPKRWNWELTTSRSSPHISLPVIQLYNAKGKLLVEAKESGSERRSWHSHDWAINNRSKIAGSNDLNPKLLQKCTSDILHRHRYDDNVLTKYDPNRFDLEKVAGTGLDKGRLQLGSYPVVDKLRVDDLKRESTMRYRKTRSSTGLDVGKEFVGVSRKPDRNTNTRYVKSKSAIIIEPSLKTKLIRHDQEAKNINHASLNPPLITVDKPRNVTYPRSGSVNISRDKSKNGDTALKKSRSALIRFSDGTTADEGVPKCKLLPDYKNNKTDDLYKRLLKYNEESIKRAITDGYKKFLNSDINKLSGNDKIEKMKKEIVRVKPEAKPEVNRVKYSKYITRTCSAGTLVIKEESFTNASMRRRRKTLDCDAAAEDSSNFRRKKELVPKRNDSVSRRDISYPHMLTPRNRHGCEKKDSLKLPAYNNLFHSKSDVFPFAELFSEGVSSSTESKNHSNYTVKEPSSESRKNSEDIGVEKLERRRRKKAPRRIGGGDSASSGTSDEDEKENNIKGGGEKNHSKDTTSHDMQVLAVLGSSGIGLPNAYDGDSIQSDHASSIVLETLNEETASLISGVSTSSSTPAYLEDHNSFNIIIPEPAPIIHEIVEHDISNWGNTTPRMLYHPKPNALRNSSPNTGSSSSTCIEKEMIRKKSLEDEDDWAKSCKRRKPSLNSEKDINYQKLIAAKLDLAVLTKEQLDQKSKREEALFEIEKRKKQLEAELLELQVLKMKKEMGL